VVDLGGKETSQRLRKYTWEKNLSTGASMIAVDEKNSGTFGSHSGEGGGGKVLHCSPEKAIN